jgi:Fe-S cluster assembly iron-binding protein IscA
MILVSELAKAALWESLQESGVAPDQGLRLSAIQGAIILDLDYATEADHVIQHRDSAVIIVDRETENLVGDAIIDIHEGEHGSELVFRKIFSNGHRPDLEL